MNEYNIIKPSKRTINRRSMGLMIAMANVLHPRHHVGCRDVDDGAELVVPEKTKYDLDRIANAEAKRLRKIKK